MQTSSDNPTCDICLVISKTKNLSSLNLCTACYDKVSDLQKTEPYKIPKEQMAGGLKNDL
ncbi:MAG: hypothetical protein K8Q89_04125 [Nitrosarchaeum sp.]|nr:hypothetical protein [Nitrosarchaeum sp.]